MRLGLTSTMLMKQCLNTIEKTIFAKQIRPLPPEPQLSDFYHPSGAPKNGELLFIAVSAGIATYALYKYLKQMKIDEEKLYEACYQPDQLWTSGKATKGRHKTTSILRKDIESWLAKQALWQAHTPFSKAIHHPHYNMTKPNEQHQLDLLYMSHKVFQGKSYKYILTGVDVALRYKVARAPKTKKSSEVAFVSEKIYKKGGNLEYPEVFQCDNGGEFKGEVAKLLEKHNADI